MGGQIAVESKLGEGSTFQVDLTLEKQADSRPTSRRATRSRGCTSSSSTTTRRTA
jgi:hypothetical protein